MLTEVLPISGASCLGLAWPLVLSSSTKPSAVSAQDQAQTAQFTIPSGFPSCLQSALPPDTWIQPAWGLYSERSAVLPPSSENSLGQNWKEILDLYTRGKPRTWLPTSTPQADDTERVICTFSATMTALCSHRCLNPFQMQRYSLP